MSSGAIFRPVRERRRDQQDSPLQSWRALLVHSPAHAKAVPNSYMHRLRSRRSPGAQRRADQDWMVDATQRGFRSHELARFAVLGAIRPPIAPTPRLATKVQSWPQSHSSLTPDCEAPARKPRPTVVVARAESHVCVPSIRSPPNVLSISVPPKSASDLGTL
jgi:hypothetical protein